MIIKNTHTCVNVHHHALLPFSVVKISQTIYNTSHDSEYWSIFF